MCEHYETECGCIRSFGCDLLLPCKRHAAKGWRRVKCLNRKVA